MKSLFFIKLRGISCGGSVIPRLGGTKLTIIISAIKIIVLLGFLILIHEAGHLLVAKWCKVKVNEFAIGFGPLIWKKQGKETKYTLRLIPLRWIL